jgi:hypothetical protein
MSTEEQDQFTGRLAREHRETLVKYTLLKSELQRIAGLLRSLGQALEEPDPKMSAMYMDGLSEQINFGKFPDRVREYKELGERLATLSQQMRAAGIQPYSA